MPSASTTSNNNKLEKSSVGPESISTESVVPNTTNKANLENASTATKEKNAAATSSTAIAGGSNPNDACNPMKISMTAIEHKIRNLEKRKTKLESYRAIQASGKELSNDQKNAVAKYESVMANLEFAREFFKNMQQISKDAEKESKKQARKDIIVKAQTETAKIREVLVIQNILICFGDEAVRADFLSGENGAIKLEKSDLDALEKICVETMTRRPENSDDVAFIVQAQKAAEIFSMTIDGRPKQFGDTTYEHIGKIFQRIQASGYLDKLFLAQTDGTNNMDGSNATENEATIVGGDAVETGEEDYSAEGEEEDTDEINVVEPNFEQENEIVEKGQISYNHQLKLGENIGVEDDRAELCSPTPRQQQVQVLAHAPQHQHQQQQPGMMMAVMPNEAAQGMTMIPMQPPNQAQNVGFEMPQMQQAQMTAAPSASGPPPNFQQAPQQAVAANQALSGANTPVHVNIYGQRLPPPTALINVPLQPTQGPPHQMINNLNQQQQQPAQMPPGHFTAPTVHAVEQNFFKQQQHQQFMQPQQQIRPLADVIGPGGGFSFLQDSELDSPEIINTVAAPQMTSANIINPNAVNSLVFEQSTAGAEHLGRKELTPKMAAETLQQQQQQTSPPQAIPTQTFTNQSFPPIAPQNSKTPSPMYMPKQAPGALFSPQLMANNAPQKLEQQQQMLLNDAQQQQQQRMMIPPHLNAPQAHMAPAAPQNSALGGLPTAEVGVFFEQNSSSMGGYNQSDLSAAAAALKLSVEDKTLAEEKFPSAVVEPTANTVINEWSAENSLARKDSNSTATKNIDINSSKWSSEMNALGTPPTASVLNSNNSSSQRKNEWSSSSVERSGTGGGGGGGNSNSYDDREQDNNNHWNSQDSGGYRRGPGNYQRRDFRDDRGPPSARGNSYRGRNYSNSSQQNGGRGSNGNSGGGGTYFRNNDNSNSGSSSYYQNGNNYGKDSSGSSRYESGGYRGPRGGSNMRSGNPPPPRMANRGGSSNSINSSSYINNRQSATTSSGRMSMGLDNKN